MRPPSSRSGTLMRGGMAEWLMAAVLKTAVRETVSWVRIPLPPPESRGPCASGLVESSGRSPGNRPGFSSAPRRGERRPAVAPGAATRQVRGFEAIEVITGLRGLSGRAGRLPQDDGNVVRRHDGRKPGHARGASHRTRWDYQAALKPRVRPRSADAGSRCPRASCRGCRRHPGRSAAKTLIRFGALTADGAACSIREIHLVPNPDDPAADTL
jgi:hypothetical protein